MEAMNGSAARGLRSICGDAVSTPSSSKLRLVNASAEWFSGGQQEANAFARLNVVEKSGNNAARSEGYACFSRNYEPQSYRVNRWRHRGNTAAVAASQNTNALRGQSTSSTERDREENGDHFGGPSSMSAEEVGQGGGDSVGQGGDSVDQWPITSNGRDRRSIEPLGAPDKERGRRPRPRRQSSVRSKLVNYIGRQAGYAWLAGPLLATAVLALPAGLVPITDLLVSSYLVGLTATLAVDLLFLLSADIFLVLTNRAGHHQAVPGGPAPWIGPWEYTGYPKGLPHLQNYVSYVGVVIGASALVLSVVTGKFLVGIAVFVPYLSLIFIQVAYERLVYSDRLPVFPLVPILYTAYRFRQLLRGLEVVAAMSGGLLLAATLRLLVGVWTLYLAMHLAQLPWLYSTWNSNRAT